MIVAAARSRRLFAVHGVPRSAELLADLRDAALGQVKLSSRILASVAGGQEVRQLAIAPAQTTTEYRKVDAEGGAVRG